MGYGDIGQEVAKIARAFKMEIFALRRRTKLSLEEQGQNLKVPMRHAYSCQEVHLHTAYRRAVLVCLCVVHLCIVRADEAGNCLSVQHSILRNFSM